MRRQGRSLKLTTADRNRLDRWIRAGTTQQRVVARSRIVLLAAEGWTNVRIAKVVGTSRNTVAVWRARFAEGGADALLRDAPGRGRKARPLPPDVAAELRRALARAPGTRRQAVEQVAARLSVSRRTVYRLVSRVASTHF